MPRKKLVTHKKKRRESDTNIHGTKYKEHTTHATTKKNPNNLKPDKALGVNRLLISYNKFHLEPKLDQQRDKKNQMGSRKTGLSPKEKNFILCNCQKRSTRYARLKEHAALAENNKKIFLIFGNSNAIRQALVERGWVEKLTPSRMDLTAIRNKKDLTDEERHKALERLFLSNLVEKSVPNFIWNLRDGWEGQHFLNSHRILHNRTRMAALWTTKQGLCASIRSNHWYYIEGVSEVVCPRTYDCADDGEAEEFEADYKLTACTNLLKWVLSMVANDRPIFVESGTISINVIVFALNRCKEYLFQQQNKDIDKLMNSNVTNGQWNAFLKKYYIVISKEEVFGLEKNSKLPLYLEFAKYMLKEINKYRPQLSCEGCHNIWILKPGHCSRGRGIKLASKLAVLSQLTKKDNYVCQKYIEESLLIHQTKFDIRQYYLVTSTYPLVIWMYQDCYLKFSSQKYNLKNFHESIHLTNNAVQKKYKNCNDRHPELPAQNMWSLDTFIKYLKKTGDEKIWDDVIYPGMKKSIIGIMLNCQENTTQWRNRFELYGCDFVLDKNYKPWLIEINSGPDLNPTTKVTAQICPAVLTDVIKVVIDHAADSKAPTGKFECIYRQDSKMRQTLPAVNLVVEGNALPNDFFHKDSDEDNFEDARSDIGNQQDVTSMLDKLKYMYGTGKITMNDIKQGMHRKIDSKSQNISLPSASNEELHAAAATIAKQMDVLSYHNMTSEESASASAIISSPSSSNFRVTSTNLDNSKTSKQHQQTGCSISSSFDINSVIVKPVSQLKLFEEKAIETGFQFSRLDDGPTGKASGLLDPIPVDSEDEEKCTEEQEQEQEQAIDSTVEIENANKEEIKQLSIEENDDRYIAVTKEIFSFLDKKHEEYSRVASVVPTISFAWSLGITEKANNYALSKTGSFVSSQYI